MIKRNGDNPRSLMHKTILSLCLLILPFNILSIVLSLFLMNNLRQAFQQSATVSLNSYANLLEQRMGNINYVLFTYPNSEPAFVQLFMNYDNWHYNLYRYRIINILEDAVNLSDSANAMFVYVPDKDDLMLIEDLNYFGGEQLKRIEKDTLIDLITDSQTIMGKWQLLEIDNTQYLFRIADYNNYCFGAYINCSDVIGNLQEDLDIEDAEIFLSNQSIVPRIGYMLCAAELSPDHMALYCLIRNSYVTRSISVWFFGIIFFFLLSVFIIPIFIYLFRKQINRPLVSLQKAFHELEGGNENYRIEDRANSAEFYAAYDSFNTMAVSLQTLHHEVMEKELSNKQLQIDFLQLQIRPHFLLNSFNVLYTLIQSGQRENSQAMVLFLSDYFRYLFRSGREMQLFSKERRLIEDYMNVSKISYPVSFEVSYQIDPILDLMRIPPLLLHSFMENIIAHALLPDRQVHIVFYGEYDNGIVTFYISDDGKGMEETARESINHIDARPIDDGKNIGIKNSIRRLKYYYGEDATVECDSELGIGTTFIITIPYNLDES